MDLNSLTEPITYEKKLICFFDILGWKDHINKAGDDPIKIGRLALLPKLLTSQIIRDISTTSIGRLTSFSDCNVVTVQYREEYLPQIINGLSAIFIGAALNGFLVRAGITIGDIHHDGDLVFGPGLNRAYELESKGKYPRIILDSTVTDLCQLKMPTLERDEDTLFADPFRLDFIHTCLQMNMDASFKNSPNPALTCLTVIQENLIQSLKQTTDSRALEKINWLYNRVRPQIKNIFNNQ